MKILTKIVNDFDNEGNKLLNKKKIFVLKCRIFFNKLYLISLVLEVKRTTWQFIVSYVYGYYYLYCRDVYVTGCFTALFILQPCAFR